MRQWIRQYFQHSRRQQRGILILVAAILFILLLQWSMPLWLPPAPLQSKINIDSILALIDTQAANDFKMRHQKTDTQISRITPFRFDPNTLDENGFVRLGLRPKLIATILNYRSKGGRFYNKESLQRIYGMRDEEFNTLEPYIEIPGNSHSTTIQKKVPTVELNTADTALLIQLPYIGSKLAIQIVKYREELGGYSHLSQLLEVWGIREETVQKIKAFITINRTHIKKININEATYAELNKHPYLKGELAKAIVTFRKANNYEINNIESLKQIELLNEENFRKIAPYISIN